MVFGNLVTLNMQYKKGDAAEYFMGVGIVDGNVENFAIHFVKTVKCRHIQTSMRHVQICACLKSLCDFTMTFHTIVFYVCGFSLTDSVVTSTPTQIELVLARRGS